MWIRFDLQCDRDSQQALHKQFRRSIAEWQNMKLVNGAVLTYHFNTPRQPEDSLYLCLDIPAVPTPQERSLRLPHATLQQIPAEITSIITENCKPYSVNLETMDYEYDIIASECSSKFYRNAPTNEILRFASTGTKIALQLCF